MKKYFPLADSRKKVKVMPPGNESAGDRHEMQDALPAATESMSGEIIHLSNREIFERIARLSDQELEERIAILRAACGADIASMLPDKGSNSKIGLFMHQHEKDRRLLAAMLSEKDVKIEDPNMKTPASADALYMTKRERANYGSRQPISHLNTPEGTQGHYTSLKSIRTSDVGKAPILADHLVKHMQTYTYFDEQDKAATTLRKYQRKELEESLHAAAHPEEDMESEPVADPAPTPEDSSTFELRQVISNGFTSVLTQLDRMEDILMQVVPKLQHLEDVHAALQAQINSKDNVQTPKIGHSAKPVTTCSPTIISSHPRVNPSAVMAYTPLPVPDFRDLKTQPMIRIRCATFFPIEDARFSDDEWTHSSDDEPLTTRKKFNMSPPL